MPTIYVIAGPNGVGKTFKRQEPAMKLKYELMDESMMDVEDLEVERDLNLAAVDAIRRARRFGSCYVIREDDQIKEIPPDRTAPYEQRLLASAERLDRRIAGLQSTNQNNILNDRPSEKK